MVIKVVHKIFKTNLDKYKTFKFQKKYISSTYKPTLGLLSSQPAKRKKKKDDQPTFNIIQIINNENETINESWRKSSDLIVVKFHVTCYWKNLCDKKHKLSLQLIVVKLLIYNEQDINQNEWYRYIF